MKKRVFFVFAGLFLMIFVPTVFAEDVVLQYWMWDPPFKDVEQEMIDRFQATHPDIKVEITAIASKEYWTKMAAMAAAREMPDVFAMSSGLVEKFAGQNAIADLTPFVEKDLNQDDYFWSILKSSFNIDGKYYAVPFAWVGTVIFYNKTLFDEAKLSYPEWGWTWDEFLEAAKALTKDTDGDGKTDTWGYTVFGRYAVTDGWIFQNDGDYLDRENRRFAPNENAVEVLTFLNDLVHSHKVAPEPRQYDLSGEKNLILFVNGQTAMITEGSWNIEYCRNTNPMSDKWDIAPLPRGPHWKEDTMYAWADGLTISANSKHPQQAWEFIKFMITERPADLYYAGKVPFAKKEAQSENWDDWKSKDLQPEHKTDILKFGANASHTFTNFWGQWRGYGSAEESGLNALLDDMYNGKLTVDELLSQADKTINRILKRAYKK